MTTRKRGSARNAAPSVDAMTYEVGTWSGIANYGCPFCPYRTLEGAALVVAHIASDHREQAIQASQEA